MQVKPMGYKIDFYSSYYKIEYEPCNEKKGLGWIYLNTRNVIILTREDPFNFCVTKTYWVQSFRDHFLHNVQRWIQTFLCEQF